MFMTPSKYQLPITNYLWCSCTNRTRGRGDPESRGDDGEKWFGVPDVGDRHDRLIGKGREFRCAVEHGGLAESVALDRQWPTHAAFLGIRRQFGCARRGFLLCHHHIADAGDIARAQSADDDQR